MSGVALKPCPFCGHAPESAVWGHHSYHRIRCDNCDIEFDYYDSLRDVAGRWNSRAGEVWLPIADAPQDGSRLMLWDSVSKRPVFASWRGGNPAITHYAAEPAGPEVP